MEIPSSPNSSITLDTTFNNPPKKEKVWLDFFPDTANYDPVYFVKKSDSKRSDSSNRSRHQNPVYVYIISLSKYINDDETPYVYNEVPKDVKVETISELLSKEEFFKNKIIKTIKVSSQSFKITCNAELDIKSFTCYASDLGWIQLHDAPQRSSYSFVFNLLPNTSNEDALVLFTRWGTVDVWRRYVGSTTTPLGNGAIVWYKSINYFMMNYLYSCKAKKNDYCGSAKPTPSTFKLACSNCRLRYHNSHCPLPTAPKDIPEHLLKFVTPSTDSTSVSSEANTSNSTPSLSSSANFPLSAAVRSTSLSSHSHPHRP